MERAYAASLHPHQPLADRESSAVGTAVPVPRARWPNGDTIAVRFCAGFAYVAAGLPGGDSLPLCRLRFTRPATHLELRPLPGRRRQLLGQHPAQRGPGGSPEEAFGCAGAIYLNALAPTIQVPAGLVVLVGPPASGKTSFLQALIARERPTGTRTTHRHRRPLQRAADHAAIRPGGHRPPPAVHRARTQRHHRRRRPPLRRDHEPRGQCRQLRSEGATTVHDVPGRRQATTPAESATHFSFA